MSAKFEMVRLSRWLIWIVVLMGSAGCVDRMIRHEAPRVRDYQPGDYAASDADQTTGSIWSDSAQGLFEDARSRRVGDIVTVRIDERSDATRDATTATNRESEAAVGVSSFLTALQSFYASNPGFDPRALISGSSSSSFTGGGQTSRSGQITATLPVRIKQRLPNGDFYIEGTKTLLLNDEESRLYLSGVIRPIDIGPDNTVPSSMMADVELEFTGRGVVSEGQAPGVLARILNFFWPF